MLLGGGNCFSLFRGGSIKMMYHGLDFPSHYLGRDHVEGETAVEGYSS